VPSEEAAKEWFIPVYKEFASHNLGRKWYQLLELYLKWEAAHKYERGDDTSQLSSHKRPTQVSRWLSSDRSRGKRPNIVTTVSFGNSVIGWWKAIQPNWRIWPRNGWPLTDRYGDKWETLNSYGPNGITAMIAALHWWGVALETDASDQTAKWQKLVSDVIWVLEGVIASFVEE
jgi:hypothetical protein